ncbi:hypothetical protein AB0K49_38735 [Streptomyces decoyicus]|uniref:hypothetical protein n=1 Tax=Streptomyces decoyicus TaxID=249567 RepID=UPI00345D74A6
MIKELPAVAVSNVERAGSSRRASSTADYTVRLPSARGGKTVPATFRTKISKGVREVGDTFPVPYAPDRPQLGAVGAWPLADVEAQLAGRTLTQGGFLCLTLRTEAGDVSLNLTASHKRAAPLLVWMLGGLFASPAKNPESGVRVGGGPAV